MTRRIKIFVAWLAVACFAAALGFRAYAAGRGVPLLAADACVFLPQTVPFRAQGELINKVWRPVSGLDPSGRARMVYHGFLFPMLLSLVMWKSDYPTLVRVIGLLNAAVGVFLLIFLWRFALRWRWEMTPGRILLAVLIATASANYLQGALGRPEFLASLCVMLAIWGASATALRWRWLPAGLAIGLLAGMVPAVAVLSGIAYAAAAAWWLDGRRWLASVVAAAVAGAVVFATLFWWYPYSFADWWEGTSRMARYAFADGDRKFSGAAYWSEYLWRGSGWFLLGTLCIISWSGSRLLFRRLRTGGSPAFPAGFCALMALGLVALLRLVLYASWASYNLLPLLPLGLLAVFHEMGRSGDGQRGGRDIFRPCALAVLLIASLGLVGDLAERGFILRSGLDLGRARELWAAFRSRHAGEPIALHEYLFTLTEDFEHVQFWRGGRIPDDARWLVVPQFYSGEQRPPTLEGFRLLEDHFNGARPSFLGMPLSKGDRGSGFAIYARQIDGG